MTSDESDRSIPDPQIEPTIPIWRAGRILGISDSTAYEIARDGRLPVIIVSQRRRVVHTAKFLELYGLERGTE